MEKSAFGDVNGMTLSNPTQLFYSQVKNLPDAAVDCILPLLSYKEFPHRHTVILRICTSLPLIHKCINLHSVAQKALKPDIEFI